MYSESDLSLVVKRPLPALGIMDVPMPTPNLLLFLRKFSLSCVLKVSMLSSRSMLYVGLIMLHSLLCCFLVWAGFGG